MLIEAVIATGKLVRWKSFDDCDLKLDLKGVDLSDVQRGIPILDSHDWSGDEFGFIDDAWVEDGKLKAALKLTGTRGRERYAMAKAGRYLGISAGFKLLKVVETGTLRSIFTREFTARRWKLEEVSFTTCPGDSECLVEPVLDGDVVTSTRYRMQQRQRMMASTLFVRSETVDGETRLPPN